MAFHLRFSIFDLSKPSNYVVVCEVPLLVPIKHVAVLLPEPIAYTSKRLASI